MDIKLKKGFYLLVKHKCLDVDTGKIWWSEPSLSYFDNELAREEFYESVMSGYDAEDMYFCTGFEVNL